MVSAGGDVYEHRAGRMFGNGVSCWTAARSDGGVLSVAAGTVCAVNNSVSCRVLSFAPLIFL